MSEGGDGWIWETIIAGLVTGLVSALLTPVVERLLASIGISFGWLSRLSAGVVSVITYRIQAWLVLAILAGGWVIFRVVKSLLSDEKDPNDYTADKIFGVLWEWRWDRFSPDKFIPICPECGLTLEISGAYPLPPEDEEEKHTTVPAPKLGPPVGSQTECEKCAFEKEWDMKPDELRKRVKKEIVRRLRSDEWKDVNSA